MRQRVRGGVNGGHAGQRGAGGEVDDDGGTSALGRGGGADDSVDNTSGGIMLGGWVSPTAGGEATRASADGRAADVSPREQMSSMSNLSIEVAGSGSLNKTRGGACSNYLKSLLSRSLDSLLCLVLSMLTRSR